MLIDEINSTPIVANEAAMYCIILSFNSSVIFFNLYPLPAVTKERWLVNHS